VNNSGSFGFLAIAGIAAGASSVLFAVVLAISCCWTKRKGARAQVNASVNAATKERPECSAYSDYDPEANISQKPLSRSSVDCKAEDLSEKTAMEQFEDEPGSSPAHHQTLSPHFNTMEDLSSDHFDDEPVTTAVVQGQAPIYIDGDYGMLKGDELPVFDDIQFIDDTVSPDEAAMGPPFVLDDGFQAFESAPASFLNVGCGKKSQFKDTPKRTSTTPRDVAEVMSFAKQSSEDDGTPRDLPPKNPLGPLSDPYLASSTHVSSLHENQPFNNSAANDLSVEGYALNSPSRGVLPSPWSPASRTASSAPPSPPQRSPSNSSHPMSSSDRSASTHAQHNIGSPVKGADEIKGYDSVVADVSRKQEVQSFPQLDSNSIFCTVESDSKQLIISFSESSSRPTLSMDEGSDGEQKCISSDEESSATDDLESENDSQAENEEDESSSGEETGSDAEEDDEDSDGDEETEEEADSEDSGSEAETIDDSLRHNNRSSVLASQQPYYDEIKSLVAQLMPDDLENVDVMVRQFAGNEAELLMTLQNMAAANSSAGNGGRDGSKPEAEMHIESSESSSVSEETSEEGSSDGDDDDEEDASVQVNEETDDKQIASSESEEDLESGDDESDSEMAAPESEKSDSEEEPDGSEESEDVEEESVYDEESYYSEEVVESDEETIIDQEESIHSEGEDVGRENEDVSSSYESDYD
jgi:hypothetical protein